MTSYTRVCDFADVFSGYAFSSSDLVEEGIPVIKIGNINDGKVSEECVSYYNKNISAKLKKYVLQKDDFLIAMTGAGSVGRVGKMFDMDRCFLVNQRVAIVRPKSNVNPLFLYYFFSMPYIEKYLYSLGIGAGQPNISSNDISNMKVIFPIKEKQDLMVDVLHNYSQLIEKNAKRIKILEQMAENLYKEWFVRFRFPGYERAEFVEGVPKGWKRCRLKEFINFNPNYKTEKKQYYTNIPMAALSTNGMYINEAEISLEEKSSGTHFRNGDVLFAKITPCLENGKTGLVTCLKDNEIGVGSTEFIVMQGAKVSSFFTYCIARNDLFRQLAINSMNGADGRQRADISFIQNIKWILPDDEILLKFEHITSAIIKQINILHKQNQNLIKQRDYLLPRLMSGKVQVK